MILYLGKSSSLLKIFKTTNGRDVIDGRGIEPDVKIEQKIQETRLKALYDNFQEFRKFQGDLASDFKSFSEKVFKELETIKINSAAKKWK